MVNVEHSTLDDALLDALWRQQHVGVGICGEDGRLERCNPALEAMVGPLRAPSFPQDWAREYDLFDASGLRPLRADEIPLARAFAGESITDVALSTRPPGEPVRFFRCTAAPLIQGSRTAGAAVLVTEVDAHGHDLAAIVDAQIARYRRRLSRLQELSARVATIGDHQIRTPLTVIQTHVELLEEDLDDLDVDEGARRTLPAIRRGIAALTAALTALSRANDLANATDPDLRSVDLLDIARRAVVAARSTHPTLRMTLLEGRRRHLSATADARWVHRAIAALIDAMAEPAGDDEITLAMVDRQDVVGVRLTRPAQTHARGDFLRNWSARGDSTNDPRGLGLALAEAVAIAHDGRMDIVDDDTSTTASLLLSREPRQPSLERLAMGDRVTCAVVSNVCPTARSGQCPESDMSTCK
jgi:signal transduction histidine kinase